MWQAGGGLRKASGTTVEDERRRPSGSGGDRRRAQGEKARPADDSTNRKGFLMQFRFLGNSGFKISEITYGNWLTHASQVENEQAIACVKASLEAGITTFDTADVYANTGAETVLGEALKGERRQSVEIFTKVFGPTGPKGPNDVGLSRKHILESIDGSLQRLQTDYVDLYQAHRFDYFTPLEETMQAFADLVRMGKGVYLGGGGGGAGEGGAGGEGAGGPGRPPGPKQPPNPPLWRGIWGGAGA